MQYRALGRTGIDISAISFGAGPVSGLMTGGESDRQRAVVESALEAGINWFDTAATYGGGRSEASLGQALAELGAASRVHLATKVRLLGDDLQDIKRAVQSSVTDSLKRLRVERITLLQLHNSITSKRDEEPTSLAPQDVLGSGGLLEAFEKLKAAGIVEHIGLTGIGQPAALSEVIRSGAFETMQVPYHLLNPSAGQPVASSFAETDYGNVIADCAEQRMGVLAIRVFAAGALLGNTPSAHTLKTLFFPLELYNRDLSRATVLSQYLGGWDELRNTAFRFVLSHPHIASALIGLGDPSHVAAAVKSMERGRLTAEESTSIERQIAESVDDS